MATRLHITTEYLQPSADRWDSAYTTTNTNSANWNTAYDTATAYSSVSGSFAANTLYQNLTGNWENTYTSVTNNSSKWESVYSTVLPASSIWYGASAAAVEFTQANFLPLTGGTISGATRINNNLTIFGNLSTSGSTIFANTVFSVTSALSVVHIGSGPAMWIGNDGDGDIASFYDIDQNIEVLHVGGGNASFPNVGVKTSAPNKDFTVKGELSASSTIYDATGNSNQWNTAHSITTTYQSTSSNFVQRSNIGSSGLSATTQSRLIGRYSTGAGSLQEIQISSPLTLSDTTSSLGILPNVFAPSNIYQNLTGNWESTYTTVQNSSANFIVQGGNTLNANLSVGTNDTRNLFLRTNNTTRVVVLSSGQVGINRTPDTNFSLDINGDIRSTNTITSNQLSSLDNIYAQNSFIVDKNFAPSNTILYLAQNLINKEMGVYGNNSRFIAIYDWETNRYHYGGSSTGNIVVNGNNNNVGIGTTSPEDKLTVVGNISASNTIRAARVNATNQILSGGVDLANIFLTTENDAQTLSFTPSSAQLSISNGNTVGLSSIVIAPSANAVFQTVSAIALSGVFYGDGSNLLGSSLTTRIRILTGGEVNLDASQFGTYVKQITGPNSFTYTNFTSGRSVILYLSANHLNFSRHYFPQTTYISPAGDANTVFTFDNYVTKVTIQNTGREYIGTTELILTNIQQVTPVPPEGPSILLDGELGYLKTEDDSYILL